MPSPSGRKPRVLYLSQVVPYPPAVAGDAVYSRGLIEAWSSVADITVLCADSGADRRKLAPDVDWNIVERQRTGRFGSVFSRFPLIAWKGATGGYRRMLRSLLREGNWDAVVLDNLGLAFALPRAREYRRMHPATKLVYVSIEWEYPTRASKYSSYGLSPAKRVAAAIDLLKVRRWENAMIRTSDLVTAINGADIEAFRRIDASVKYVPVLPGYDGPVTPSRTITDDTPRRVLILGGRRAEQKQQVLLDWLAVATERLNAAGIDTVVLGDIPDQLRERIAREYPDVTVLGFVDELEQTISQARAGLVVDTVGGGFKLRLLSHVFQRLPIVGLRQAVSGLPTPEGAGYLVADTLDELVSLVCSAIDEPEVLDAVQHRAYSDCEKEFSWQERARVLDAMLRGESDSVLV